MAYLPPEYHRHTPEDTVLYQVVQEYYPSFIRRVETDPNARGFPDFVKREFEEYLRCGILAHGFLRVLCQDCQHTYTVAFSCKRRGFCPSCGARRMCEIGAHLVDHVIPWVPVRQWVFTVPVAMRYWMASHAKMLSWVHTLVIREISRYYRRKVRAEKGVTGKLDTGSVTFVQKFGSALNLNCHFHIAFLEGVYRVMEDGEPDFCYVDPPSNEDVATVLTAIVDKVVARLRKDGFLPVSGEDSVPPMADLFAEHSPPLAQSMEASTRNFIALGERRGLPVRFIGKGFGSEGESPELKGCRSVAVNGFTLHADTFVKDMDRRSLEKLLRYTSRSSIALDRLERNSDGDIVYQLKRKWKNGKTHVLFSPYEFLEKMASLVPLPRKHLTRFSGVLGPHHKLRKKIVPKPSPETVARCRLKNMEYELSPEDRMRWALLLKRVYDIDISICPKCDGPMKIVGAITQPDLAEKILKCLGLPARAPPLGQTKAHWLDTSVGQ